jgi:uncharacterized membrane protein
VQKVVTKLQKRIWIFPTLALVTILVGKICASACAFFKGDILGLDLEIFGIAFYSVLLIGAIFYNKFYPKDWVMKVIAAVVAIGVGAEYVFIKFQIQNSTYCPKCIISGASLLAMFFVLIPHMKKWLIILLILCGVLFTSFTFSGSLTPLYAEEISTRGFGNEKSQTWIIAYSAHFCPARKKQLTG